MAFGFITIYNIIRFVKLNWGDIGFWCCLRVTNRTAMKPASKNRQTVKRMKKGGAVVPRRKLPTADILAIFGIVLALVFGILGYRLGQEQVRLANEQIRMAEEQGRTSLDIQHFNYLLEKTDRILGKDSELTVLGNKQIDTLLLLNRNMTDVVRISGSQLLLNQQEQRRYNTNYENSMIGHMNRLKETALTINGLFHDPEYRLNSMAHNEAGMRAMYGKLGHMKDLFVAGMDNPYLNSVDTLTQLWSMAYGIVGNIRQQIGYRLQFIGKPVQNLNTGRTEIQQADTVGLSSYIAGVDLEYFMSVTAATDHAIEWVKKDKIKRGLLDRDGKSKINLEGLWH